MSNGVAELGLALVEQGLRMAIAESCTGGLGASSLTDVPGSSTWFEGGLVAYDNRIKMKLLSVPEDILIRYGAVSRECVESMASGVCRLFEVPVGVAVSGIAGPGGGTQEKPVGTVWMAWKVNDRIGSQKCSFDGDRLSIKGQSVAAAVAMVCAAIKNGTF